MKKLLCLVGFVFCVVGAANGQLVYKDHSLWFNPPSDNFKPVLAQKSGGGIFTFWLADFHVFHSSEQDSEFYIRPGTYRSAAIGPQYQGYVGFKDIYGNFHDIHVKNVLVMSDERLKTGIRSVGNATSTILKLRPVTYQFTNASSRVKANSVTVSGANGTETGFLAQEVAQVLPNAVAMDRDGNMLVNYISIIPLLVKTVQEQQAQIDALKTKVANLKDR